jgi:integrase
VARPKGTGGKARELSTAEIHRIDKCLTETRNEARNRAMLYLGLGSGMRIAEITGLRIRDIAPHGEVVSQVVLEKHSTKSKRSRAVHLSPQAVKRLKAYLRERAEAADRPELPVFPSQKRPTEPITANSGVTILKKMFNVAGVENVSSHSLRRTHANRLRRNGVDLKIIQQQLGHSSLAVTERYFEVDPVEIERAVSALRF